MATRKQIGDIFDILSKGKFICSNSGDDNLRRLYDYIDNKFDSLRDYFKEINFILERGPEFFYFSRPDSKADMERKITSAFKWIDILDFFKNYGNSFCVGDTFTASEIKVSLDVNSSLKQKLIALKKYTKADNFDISIKFLIDQLKNDGFIEMIDEISQRYKILSSFNYLETLISTINIPEETQNEIPE